MLSIFILSMVLMVTLPVAQGQDYAGTYNTSTAACNSTTCCCPPASVTVETSPSASGTPFLIKNFVGNGHDCKSNNSISVPLSSDAKGHTVADVGTFTLKSTDSLEVKLEQNTETADCTAITMTRASSSVPSGGSSNNGSSSSTPANAASSYRNMLYMKFLSFVTTTIFIIHI